MNRRFARAICTLVLTYPCISGLTALGQLPVADLPEDREVKYSTDIYPVLKKNCVACHNASRDESGVNLESVEKMLASDSDELLVAGKSDTSRLFVLAAHIDEPIMPPEDNEVGAAPLSPMELALLKRWIDQGAKVDVANPGMVKYEWQALPAHLRTVYASTMSGDGRLAAASFGNQIRVFGKSSSVPIAELSSVDEAGKPTPPHLDFVQDLAFSPVDNRLVSAGFRNVKTWTLNPPQSIELPSIDPATSMSLAIDRTGNQVANFTKQGDVQVAAIGADAWQWTQKIALPEAFAGDAAPAVVTAVSADGKTAAIAWQQELRIVKSDVAEAVALTSEKPIASIVWDRNGRLVTGDESGGVTFWVAEGESFKPVTESMGDKPVLHLVVPGEGAAVLMAVDAAGKIAAWHAAETKIKETKQLPAAAKFVSPTRDGTGLWTTLDSGVFGLFDIASGKLAESPKFDPVQAEAYAQANWDVLVGERLVAATEAELKTAQTNETAEKTNLTNSEADVAAKAKARDEAKKPAEDTKKAADAAKAALAAEQAKQKAMMEKRVALAAKIKQLDDAAPAMVKEKETVAAAAAEVATKMTAMQAEIAAVEAEMKKKLDEMKAAAAAIAKQKADQEAKVAAIAAKIAAEAAAKTAAAAELKAIPDDAALAAAVKKAADAADKAQKDAAAKAEALKKAETAVSLSEESKSRAAKRAAESTEEVASQTKLVAEAKAEQEQRKKQAEAAKGAQDQSLAADKALAVLNDGKFLVTQSSASGQWNLWTAAGDWIAALDKGGEMVAAGSQSVLIRGDNGKVKAYRLPANLWGQERMIGSPTGESPFSDRVLTVDIDPTGKWLVTGGGEPSRSGEVQIWNLADGSLVRTFENPHTDTVLCARFSPDGKTLATSSSDRMIKLWDIETGKLLKTLEGHTHHVNSIAWNVNNRQLSSASADATVKIWDVSTGQAKRTIGGLSGELTRLVYVGRDDRVGFVSGDNHFRVYRTDNGGRETNAKVAEGYLYALASNREGTLFVLGGADGNAKIVDKAGKETQKYE
ncbi:c-type cytochrome domain-containing protein [Rosistilla oblonga]|uniref:WD40 domain-containing protein n=1 Tax=Rosistilla oblonga TaxID=2527990 RepID=UPI003A96E636